MKKKTSTKITSIKKTRPTSSEKKIADLEGRIAEHKNVEMFWKKESAMFEKYYEDTLKTVNELREEVSALKRQATELLADSTRVKMERDASQTQQKILIRMLDEKDNMINSMTESMNLLGRYYESKMIERSGIESIKEITSMGQTPKHS